MGVPNLLLAPGTIYPHYAPDERLKGYTGKKIKVNLLVNKPSCKQYVERQI